MSQTQKHLHKPYRAHHLVLGAVALLLLVLSLVSLTAWLATPPPPNPEIGDGQVQGQQTNTLTTVPLGHDGATFHYNEMALDLEQVNENSVTLRPRSGMIDSYARASSLSLHHQSTELTFDDGFLLGSDEVVIGELTYQRDIRSYEAGRIKRVTLSPADTSHHVTIDVRGLISSSALPHTYQAVIKTLSVGSTSEVLGQQSDWVGRSDSTRAYVSDLVSPAVVKLYHVMCGEILLGGDIIPGQQCRATTGSGFFISSDGLVATNGHVVVYEPEDALIDVLLSDPQQLNDFLRRAFSLSADEVARLSLQPEKLAGVVSQIYRLPDDTVSFTEKDQVILAASGKRPLLPQTKEEIFDLLNFTKHTDIRRAELIDYDYSGKDQLNILSGNTDGFSSSDVALLQVETDEVTPLVHLAAPADITPGQPITIVGFPADAENELVDTTELVPSTTSGTVSSLRTAAGGQGSIIQTDADASQGNSGGPAVLDSNGHAIGVLTYRFKDEIEQNAPKSYVRDIADVRTLLKANHITLNINSETQSAWSRGLEYYAQQRFSRALEEFAIVADNFPEHRLVERYITNSDQMIADGHERVPLGYAYVGLGGGVGLLFISGHLVHSHRRRHNEHATNEWDGSE